ncbi:MAG TPA: glutathione S-transferase, partial [Candidatus Binatia bacterium]
FEDAGAAYVDVARRPRGIGAMSKFLESRSVKRPPFAPPFLKAGKLLIAQTANILFFLGPRLGLAPKDEAARLWAHQLQLTIADWVAEVHDTHHPVASSLYYEEQKRESKRRAEIFRVERQPKFLTYFEQILERNGGRVLIGNTISYVDLSLFQMIEGLRYAFPRAMGKEERKYPRIIALHDRTVERPRLAAYLASERRLPFNQDGIFRQYAELDDRS